MSLISQSIKHPVATISSVILVVMFGIVSLLQLPIQLTPDVEQPQITVRTTWAGASPYEIEKEIIEPQEEVLKSVQGLLLLESASYNDYGEVTMTFKVGTSLNTANMLVSNKLNEVSSYPENALKPVINTSGADSSPIIWMMFKKKEEPYRDIRKERTFFENEVRARLERVDGVGSLFVLGGTEEQLEVVVDTTALANNQLTIDELSQRIQRGNKTTSAGVQGISRRNYRIRTLSEFQSPEDVESLPIRDDGFYRITVADVAEARIGYEPKTDAVLHNGMPMIIVGVRKESGANVLDLTRRVRKVVNEINDTVLAQHGLYFDWVYDQTPYINTAIEMVQINLVIGALLAIAVLLLFLRSISSTITVAIAIPVSAMGTFIFLYLGERSINVVSLAGISFAVGMLVDNSIVVLENIDRHRRMGKSAFKAAFDGTNEVWGAVLASTVTTVAVFLPVLFIEEEAGQLFRDIAIAITASIIFSLVVSISVIPTIIRRFYARSDHKSHRADEHERPVKLHQGNRFVRTIMILSELTLKSPVSRLATVLVFVAGSYLVTMWLLPKAEYLPQGNRNLILNILVPPPGYSVEKREQISEYVYDELKPYIEEDNVEGFPQIKQLFFVSHDSLTLFGGLSAHETRAKELMPLFNRVMQSIPDMFGVSLQAGIFENGIGKGRSIDVNVSGEDNEEIVNAARVLYGTLAGAIQGAQIRPMPSLEISYPEARILPDRNKLLANGLDETSLGTYIDIIMDGRKISEYKPDGKKEIDLVLRSDEAKVTSPEDILDKHIVNNYGQLVRIGDVAELSYTTGVPQINHRERKRTVTLQVTPPPEMPLQTALELISQKLVPSVQDKGLLDAVEITVGGNADKLTETKESLQWNFILAILITYLLMSALFSNYLYPLIILVSVPLAAAGGFIGLSLVNQFVAPQPFDILVMLGFVILVGTVVNNAILIVHQSLNNVRFNGMDNITAILWSVRTRIRPIFMSTTTSLFGLFPLVIATGAGSEIYRGLGSVILGGLALSTLLTLFVIPALLAFFIHMEKPQIREE
ncbi:efflux RND transporter permease subunit [Litoribrevibacter albus]|uniref:Acriflavine resistance protein B n=1 Tax=Litoribrevibacter albus TaxID=1473156 RepID=A0AA37SCW4_9GAMM|nr:efflux RND transporter permease subunit [Litoribrevibacter albus]GLQ32148.1 acriflavine resistance protein B [Litoribrevibacter albus]